MSRKLRARLAIIASLFILLFNPTITQAEETNPSENEQTNDIIENDEIQNEENADYVVPSDSELDALGRYEVDINVDENGEPFNPSGDLDGKKQFLSFRTADNEVYYIVVTYVGNSSTVNLLKSVSNEDIEALSQATEKAQAPQAGEATVDNSEQRASENSSKSLNDPDEEENNVEENSEEKSESKNSSWLIIAVVFIAVLVIGFIRKKKGESDEYE